MRNDDPTFNERIATALSIVTADAPDSFVCEAIGTSSKGYVTDPADIDKLTVIFSDIINDTTITIKELSPGEFEPPQVAPTPWTDDNPITDITACIEMTAANQAKIDAGYDAPYTEVTLCNPVRDPQENPYFVFNIQSKLERVFVDSVTGDVHVE